MLIKADGDYSEVEFDQHLNESDVYIQKARLIDTIAECDRTLADPDCQEHKQLKLLRESAMTQLETMD